MTKINRLTLDNHIIKYAHTRGELDLEGNPIPGYYYTWIEIQELVEDQLHFKARIFVDHQAFVKINLWGHWERPVNIFPRIKSFRFVPQ